MSALAVKPDIQPGDVIDIPTGISRTIERFVVHSIHWYDNGAASLRARYACNPRGIDWSLFMEPGAFSVRLIARGVARVDNTTRTLLP
jgi:hypothetical protein